MKKMPSLFVRTFNGHTIANITSEVTIGCEWVFKGEGSIKRDKT